MTRGPSSRRITPELLEQMVALIPEAASLREIGRLTGAAERTVRQTLSPFLAIMKLNGTHPKCGCGRDRFHPGGCAAMYHKHSESYIPGVTADKHAAVLARRERIVRMLTDGDAFSDIALVEGIAATGPAKYMRHMTDEQRAQRLLNMRAITTPLSGLDERHG